MTYKDILKIALCPWIDTDGIMQLADCGVSTATKLRTDVENKILESGKKLPKSNKRHVPTKMVLDYLGLDENYIVKMASLV